MCYILKGVGAVEKEITKHDLYSIIHLKLPYLSKTCDLFAHPVILQILEIVQRTRV